MRVTVNSESSGTSNIMSLSEIKTRIQREYGSISAFAADARISHSRLNDLLNFRGDLDAKRRRAPVAHAVLDALEERLGVTKEILESARREEIEARETFRKSESIGVRAS